MTSIATRTSVLALVVESTEATPVAPSAATEYVAMQDDFAMSPSLDQLENAEISGSLGKRKTLAGAEHPQASFSHYLRHSGTEGTAPDYNDLLKAFFGTETVAGTAYTTTSSSTTVLIKSLLATSHFVRGQGFLLKDTTNGYSIRVVHSVGNTTDITPSFPVAVAPATGMGLGKCVMYSPAESGHQTLTVWHYLGNGGATEMMSGARVTALSLSAKAGQLINMSLSLEGVGFYLNPIQVTSATKYIDWTDDTGTFAAAVTVQWYKNAGALADAIQTAMAAANPALTPTVTYSQTAGTFTFKTTGTVLTLKWNTGTNTANSIATKVGFTTAADSSGTGATTGYTGTAQTYTSPYTPTIDSADPLVAKNQEILIGDGSTLTTVQASSVDFNGTLGRREIESIAAESGISGSIINGRSGTVKVTVLLDKYDIDKFKRMLEGTDTRFQYNFGTKVGGNWVAGKCGYLYLPNCTVTSYEIVDDGGLATCNFELTPYVDSSANGEMYLGFL